MQERYLGDVHDFLKYKFLRHLKQQTKLKIGLNWYLTLPEEVDPKNNKDGEKRFHLTGDDSGQWANWDNELFDDLKIFKSHSKRKLKIFYNREILDVTYFDDLVPNSNLERLKWHKKGIKKFKDCDIIFFDPDNGIKVPSAKGKRIRKYAKNNEIKEYLENGKAVITSQFARQIKPKEKAGWVRSELNSVITQNKKLPIMQCRVSPNILFVPVAPNDKYETLQKAIKSFAETSPKMPRLIGRRVELI